MLPTDPHTAMALAQLANALTGPLRDMLQIYRDSREPALIEERAHAEAKAALMRGQAEAELAVLRQRAQQRLMTESLRHQENLEAIVVEAARQLPLGSTSIQPLDPDWQAFFQDSCRDVGDEQMRMLWGKLLAGEVGSPGSFSRRTLASVKLLARREALLFKRFSSYAIEVRQGSNSTWFHFPMPEADEMLRADGVDYGALMALRVIGLLSDEGGAIQPYWWPSTPDFQLRYGGRAWHGQVLQENDKSLIPALPVTEVGGQLIRVIDVHRIEAYESLVIGRLGAQGLRLDPIEHEGPAAP